LSIKLEERAETVLLGREGGGREREEVGFRGEKWPNNACTYE
jgi:hypothetical protein